LQNVKINNISNKIDYITLQNNKNMV
jgi:hypothetical protein